MSSRVGDRRGGVQVPNSRSSPPSVACLSVARAKAARAKTSAAGPKTIQAPPDALVFLMPLHRTRRGKVACKDSHEWMYPAGQPWEMEETRWYPADEL
jgi:hypothetical protein